MDLQKLHQLSRQTLQNLSTEDGILASDRNEIFGCFFGRDGAITTLKGLKAHKQQPLPELLPAFRKTLLTLTSLQGKEVNLESGERPGQIIHEYRLSNHEHLTQPKEDDPTHKPWHVYPDGSMRNFDSIDATPLTLIALYKYWQITQDDTFLITVLPAVEAGLNWLFTFGDPDGDQFIEYDDFSKIRQGGGLKIQSWTDSHQSLANIDGNFPPHPIASIEAQAYAWLAYHLWADFYSTSHPEFAQKLLLKTCDLKSKFNEKFIIKDQGLFYGTQALDGDKNQITTITANPLLCLWAAHQDGEKIECIVDDQYIPDFVERAFREDLFVPDAGIRTMSSLSPTFNPNRDSYHNGSFWPMLNGLIAEGLKNFGFFSQAAALAQASLLPIAHFGCPIELYIKKDGGGYETYLSRTGQEGCYHQGWSAANILDLTTGDYFPHQTLSQYSYQTSGV